MTRAALVPTLALWTAASAAAAAPDAPRRALPWPVRGVALALHDASPGRSYRGDLAEIRALGANAVSLLPTWLQPDVRAPAVVRGKATRAQLEEALAGAREEGLAVLVAPMVELERLGEGEWRGVLAPPDWDAWFASYRDRLLDVAALAEAHGAAALLVGSELCSSERHETRWRALVRDVRRVFHGSLGYQANWDHRDAPRFLDALDFAAANAYFELARDRPDAPVEALVEAWAPYRAELLGWARGLGLPLVLTEVGYPSVPHAAAFPWDYARDAPVDLDAQRRAYQAFFLAWWGRPGFQGAFVYEWWGEGGPGSRGYTPRGKPAGQVLARWFARPDPALGPPAPAPAPGPAPEPGE